MITQTNCNYIPVQIWPVGLSLTHVLYTVHSQTKMNSLVGVSWGGPISKFCNFLKGWHKRLHNFLNQLNEKLQKGYSAKGHLLVNNDFFITHGSPVCKNDCLSGGFFGWGFTLRWGFRWVSTCAKLDMHNSATSVLSMHSIMWGSWLVLLLLVAKKSRNQSNYQILLWDLIWLENLLHENQLCMPRELVMQSHNQFQTSGNQLLFAGLWYLILFYAKSNMAWILILQSVLKLKEICRNNIKREKYG